MVSARLLKKHIALRLPNIETANQLKGGVMSQLTIETFHRRPGEVMKLNLWMFENIQPYIKGRTLEATSGSGLFSSCLVEQGIPIHLNDTNNSNRQMLRERFTGSGMKAIHSLDLLRQDFEQYYSSYLGAFSTLISLNITEFAYHEKIELDNAKRLLRKGGHLIFAAPSFTALYPGLEQDLEDLNRYNGKTLRSLLSESKILKIRYFSLEDMAENTAIIPTSLGMIVIARKK
jgi:hypothetical protein